MHFVPLNSLFVFYMETQCCCFCNSFGGWVLTWFHVGSLRIKMSPTTCVFKHLSDVGVCWVISKVQKEISSSHFTGFHSGDRVELPRACLLCSVEHWDVNLNLALVMLLELHIVGRSCGTSVICCSCKQVLHFSVGVHVQAGFAPRLGTVLGYGSSSDVLTLWLSWSYECSSVSVPRQGSSIWDEEAKKDYLCYR